MAMFLDTSGLLSIFDVREKHHIEAIELFQKNDRRITTSYVTAELISIMIARRIRQESMLRFVRSIHDDRRIEFVWVTPEVHQSGMDLLGRRLDKTYTLCDAISFVVMEEYKLSEALTTDQHFEQQGYVRLLK
jgi:predicted nucleic acid-binding protein